MKKMVNDAYLEQTFSIYELIRSDFRHFSLCNELLETGFIRKCIVLSENIHYAASGLLPIQDYLLIWSQIVTGSIEQVLIESSLIRRVVNTNVAKRRSMVGCSLERRIIRERHVCVTTEAYVVLFATRSRQHELHTYTEPGKFDIMVF